MIFSNTRRRFFWSASLILFFLILPLVSFAQTTDDKAAREAQLRAQLSVVESQIAEQTSLLRAKQKETASVQRDIDILNFKIKTAQLNIQAKQIEIARLGTDIGKKVKTIGVLNLKIEDGKVSLAKLLRQTRELDNNGAIDVALGATTMSDFFSDLTAFQFIQEAMANSFAVIRGTKIQTEKQKVVLEDRRDTEVAAKIAIEAEKANIEQLNKQKNVLLKLSKAQESGYKSVIASKQKERSQILNALFKLRDAKGISFGQALEYANQVSKKIGIRPAYLLAIITQESDISSGTLGVNVGTCNRPQDTKKWRDVMKPTRDYEPFLAITKSLGIDPDTVPVSCPYGGGYGGAMGPAQFIPSTWVLYIDRISKITGNRPPNPWNAEDAFAASGLLLVDNGAIGGNYAAERKAALKYYAGGNWSNPKNAFYGDQVMAKATKYQAMIDSLQGG
jgi:peptidoglycan hydrolase CwlO-like protein